MKIYMDTCCLSRPFDDPADDRTNIEAEAVNHIIKLAKEHQWTIFSSDVIDFELSKSPSRTERIFVFYKNHASKSIRLTPESIKRAQYFQKHGIKPMDSYHLAVAEENLADLFLTTDDKLLSRAKTVRLNMEVANPSTWLMEISNGH